MVGVAQRLQDPDEPDDGRSLARCRALGHLHRGGIVPGEDKMKKQAIIGYLLFDDDKPVRRGTYKGETFYTSFLSTNTGVSLFPDRTEALKVKRHLRSKYAGMMILLDPTKEPSNQSAYSHWMRRMESLRISCVVLDNAIFEGEKK